MYHFALRPWWLVSHVFALGLVVLFVNLGLWQLDRHDQRAERNRTVEARAAMPVVEVGELVGDPPDEMRYRPVSARGEYVAGSDLLIDNRSNDGLPGAWVVTPLRLEDGSVLAVSRGFVGFDSGRLDPPAPPSGTVEVLGTAVPWDGDGCGVRADGSGRPVGAACLSQEAFEDVVGEQTLPLAVQRVSSDPVDGDALVPVPPPELDAGPHRSYAVQWFIFATIGVVGYPLILRRVARDRTADGSGQ